MSKRSTARPVIIDTDPGVDDAMALCLALASPELEVIGITIVHGNHHDLSLMGANACKILELVGRPDIPVFLGEDKAIARPRPKGNSAIRCHGSNAFGDVAFAPAGNVPSTTTNATDFIIEACTTHAAAGRKVTLVTLGPLTNIARAVHKAPGLVSQVHAVYAMAGALGCPGNRTLVAEANVMDDPEATRVVLEAEWDVVLCPLNLTMTIPLSIAFLESLSAECDHDECVRPRPKKPKPAGMGGSGVQEGAEVLSKGVDGGSTDTSTGGPTDTAVTCAKHHPISAFLLAISRDYIGFYGTRGYPHGFMHDATPVLALVAPRLFERRWRDVHVHVVCRPGDICDGQTIGDMRGRTKDKSGDIRSARERRAGDKKTDSGYGRQAETGLQERTVRVLLEVDDAEARTEFRQRLRAIDQQLVSA